MQLTRAGLRQPDPSMMDAWQREFAEHHCVHVRGFLEPLLLAWLRRKLAAAPFVNCLHEDLDPPSVDLLMTDAELSLIVSTLFNDGRLFGAVERMAGCDRIGYFQPRVYAMDPGEAHHDTWHGDLDGNRMVALSANVGEAYEGGILKIREVGSHQILHQVANTGPGDAILFRIREGLEHYVTPVSGSRRKLAIAGWFQRTPRAIDRIKRSAGVR